MKRILPFALSALSVFALFAASPILPTLGIPLNVEKVLSAMLPDAWEAAVAEPSFTGDNAIITSYCIGEVGQILPTVDDNGIEGYWSVLTADGTLVPVVRAITTLDSIPAPTYVQKGSDIDGEAAGDLSGNCSLSSDGLTLAVGAYNNDGNGSNAGHVRVYSWNGSSWVQKGSDIDGEAAGDYFGNSVSLSSDGGTLAVGAPYNDGNGDDAGHVRVYSWNGSAWVQQGSDIDGEAADDNSGWSVSLSSNGLTLAVGADGNNGNGSNAGHVRVYSWNGSSWVQQGSDIDGEAINDYSGYAVSLSSDGGTLAVGAGRNDGTASAAGHVRVYSWNGSSWVQQGSDIDGEAADDWSGSSVSLSSDGGTLAVGAAYNDGNGSGAGHVRVYSWNGSAWVQQGSDIDGEAAGDASGVSVSLSADGSMLAVGAYTNSGNGSNAGHVRVFSWNGSSWVQQGSDIDAEAAENYFGSSVSLSADGGRLAVGAGGPNSFAGHVRVFELEGYNESVAFTYVFTPLNTGTNSVVSIGIHVSKTDEARTMGVIAANLETTLDEAFTEYPIASFGADSVRLEFCTGESDGEYILPDSIGGISGHWFTYAGENLDSTDAAWETAHAVAENKIDLTAEDSVSLVFIPDPGQCAAPFYATAIIEDAVDGLDTPAFSLLSTCEDETLTLPTSSSQIFDEMRAAPGGTFVFDGWFELAGEPVTTTEGLEAGAHVLTFYPYAGQCAESIDVTVYVTPATPLFETVLNADTDGDGTALDLDVCVGQNVPLSALSNMHNGGQGTRFWGRWFQNGVEVDEIATAGAGTATYEFVPYALLTADTFSLDELEAFKTEYENYDNELCPNSTETPVLDAFGDTLYWNDYYAGIIPAHCLAECLDPFTVQVTVHAVNPLFNQLKESYCVGETADALPVQSNNNITGTWSAPAVSTASAGTFTYTFTPDANANPCADPYTLTVTVAPRTAPVFVDTTLCLGSAAYTLPTTSKDGVTGTWNAASHNPTTAGAFTYTFTPNGAFTTCFATATMTIRVAPSVALSCPSNVNVTLDPLSCTKDLTFEMLLINGCPGTSKIIVSDNNPLNGPTIDCPGTWTYGIFTANNQLICWGTVNAEDKSGPVLTNLQGKCNANGISLPAAPLYGTINGGQPVANWQVELMCTDVAQVYNKDASWQASGVAGAYYTGRPVFADACHTHNLCDCQTTVKATDQLTYFPCDQAGSNNDIKEGYWAKIVRTFTATDCRGNVSTVVQEIYFRRPPLADANGTPGTQIVQGDPAADHGIFVGDTRDMPGILQLRHDACSADPATMIAALKKGDYANVYKSVAQPKYIFDDLLSCNTAERYSYFTDAVGTANYNYQGQVFGNLGAAAAAAGTVSKRLECNYSFDVEKVAEFPVCNGAGGMKVQVEVSAFDWCTGKRTTLDHIMLKWTDDTKPAIAWPTKPVVISTGAVDCTASFGIDHQSLIDYFGITVSDNCGATPTVNVSIETCEYPTQYGIVTGTPTFNTTNYRTMNMTVGGKSRLMVLGVPVGRHRLTITAQDQCYNQDAWTFDFVVADKVAPVMKCNDDLNVTLSNSQTGGYGQTHPTTGYDVDGYAKVLVSEVNAGSWDNCAMDWVRVRRAYNPAAKASFVAAGYDSNGDGNITSADGIDWNNDGDINDVMEKFEASKVDPSVLMTPALDFVEFFCQDQGDAGVMIELWGKDKTTDIVSCSPAIAPVGGVAYPTTSGGNLNYCWQVIHLEDKVYPTFVAPWPAAINCTQRAWLDSLSTARTVNLTSSTYQFLEQNIFLAQNKGAFTVMSGNDCQNLNVEVAIAPVLHCNEGTVTLTYTATKMIKGAPVKFAAGTTTVTISGVHEYNIQFPGDVSGSCADLRDTANVADGGELGCDVLAVNVTDKRYNGAISGGQPVAECYKIFRTFTVINWCQYNETCGEPMQWAVIVPRNPDGTDNVSNGVNVLVRDADRDGAEEIYFEDGVTASPVRDGKNLTAAAGELVPQGTVAAYNNGRAGLAYNNVSNQPCSSTNEKFAWMYTQHIFVHDKTAPVIADQTVAPFVQNKNTCLGPVSITITATDNCAATEIQNANSNATGNLAIERILLKANGGAAVTVASTKVSPNHALNGDAKGAGSWTYSDNLPLGNHSLLVVVRDDCGNLSLQKEIPFSVVDNDPIAPICFHGLSTDLMLNPATGNGEMAIWATDFKASDVYDCNGQGPKTDPTNANHEVITKYYVVKDVNGDGAWTTADGLKVDAKSGNLIPTTPSTSVVFTCDDLGGETEATVFVRLYTVDEQGNWGWCETYANITDARGVCSGPAAGAAAVAGAIATESNLNVEGVEVSLSGDATMTYATNVNGQFNFNNLKQGYDYTVTPQLDKNYLNGVSTFDLVLITKHILGVQPLNSAYKLIAADVNNSKSVTTLDLIQLRKLILNIDTKFANNTSWRFVDASYKFANAANPWAAQFPEVVNLNDVSADVRANFVAIKIGDVNGNAVASSQVRTAGTFGLNVADQSMKAGNEYTVVFNGDLSQIDGYQFTLGLDLNAVELVNLEAGVAKEENFGIFAKEGVITASWNGDANSSNLFTLVVRAKADANLSEVLSLSSRYTAAEAYNKAGEQLNVALNFTGSQPVAAGFDLKQNTPNPFAGETVIGFNLPVAGDATLTIQDVTGRTLRVVKGTYAQGYNQVTLKANELKATGVLYYTLESGDYTATRKMIIVE